MANGSGGYQAVSFNCNYEIASNSSISGKTYITDYGNPYWEIELDSPQISKSDMFDNEVDYTNRISLSSNDPTAVVYFNNDQFLEDIGSTDVSIPIPDDSSITSPGGITRGTLVEDPDFPNNYIIGTKGNNYVDLVNINFYTGFTFKRGTLFQISEITVDGTLSDFGINGTATALNVNDKIYMVAEDKTITASSTNRIKIFPRLLTTFTSAGPFVPIPLQFFKGIPTTKNFSYDTDINNYYKYATNYREIA